MNAIDTTVDMTPAQAEAAVRDARAEQGFGVLTEIDVAGLAARALDIGAR